MQKVIVGYPLMLGQLERLRNASPDILVEYTPLNTKALADALVDDAVVGVISPRLPSDLAQTPKLRWQQVTSAGIDYVLATGPAPWTRGVLLTNAAGAYAVPIAQYVLAYVLRIAERMALRDEAQAKREWGAAIDEEAYTGRQLREQTLLIVGYGGIGREIARLGRAFGLRILAVKSRPEVLTDRSYRLPGTGDPDGTIPDVLAGVDRLDELLPQADYVVLSMPLTPATRGLISADRIALLGQRRAWLINVARGPLADEEALAAALRARALGGAVLDVFGEEPLPPDRPFWGLPNTIVTPHVSGADLVAPTALADLFAQNLRRFANGEPLLNVVDPAREY
jgi:phosphoglycerate dehydrogenase-like enzyme